MKSLILAGSRVYGARTDFIGVSAWKNDGFVFRFANGVVVFDYFGHSKRLDVKLQNNEILYVAVGDEVFEGYLPALSCSDEYEELSYFSEDVAVATKRVSRREVSELLIERHETYSLEGPIYFQGYENGTFYGVATKMNSVVGVKAGEISWEVKFKPLDDFRVLYPFTKDQFFYLFEGNNLKCYSYIGGGELFDFLVYELPSEIFEFDGRTVLQTSTEIIALDMSGDLLGRIELPHNKSEMYQGHHLLANDDNHIYVVDRTVSDVVIYDYSLTELHRVPVPENSVVHFQRVSSELNAVHLEFAKERVIGSSFMSFWHPNEALNIESFVSDEGNYSVERVQKQGNSSYEVSIDADNKHDFFRICDVIVLDVANKYGEDYCERPDVDRQFGGDIRVLVNPKLFTEEPEWMNTVQERLNNLIKEYGGNMHSGVVSGDKKKHIEVVLVPAST